PRVSARRGWATSVAGQASRAAGRRALLGSPARAAGEPQALPLAVEASEPPPWPAWAAAVRAPSVAPPPRARASAASSLEARALTTAGMARSRRLERQPLQAAPRCAPGGARAPAARSAGRR